MRVILALLALVLPPVILVALGSTPLAITVTALWIVGQAVCWLLYAGPGLALCALASAVASVAILFGRRKPHISTSPQ